MLDRLFVIIALVLIGAMGICVAIFPRAFPRLVNSYYSLTGMKTRVADEDYAKPGVRLAGAFIVIAELIWIFQRFNR
jgi:hypothetical protein